MYTCIINVYKSILLCCMSGVISLYKCSIIIQSIKKNSGSNSSFSLLTEYKRISDASIAGENYRCWPSYQHDGCMLSVFSVVEAIDVCESHAQCRAFIMTNQSTWTGNILNDFCLVCNAFLVLALMACFVL